MIRGSAGRHGRPRARGGEAARPLRAPVGLLEDAVMGPGHCLSSRRTGPGRPRPRTSSRSWARVTWMNAGGLGVPHHAAGAPDGSVPGVGAARCRPPHAGQWRCARPAAAGWAEGGVGAGTRFLSGMLSIFRANGIKHCLRGSKAGPEDERRAFTQLVDATTRVVRFALSLAATAPSRRLGAADLLHLGDEGPRAAGALEGQVMALHDALQGSSFAAGAGTRAVLPRGPAPCGEDPVPRTLTASPGSTGRRHGGAADSRRVVPLAAHPVLHRDMSYQESRTRSTCP